MEKVTLCLAITLAATLAGCSSTPTYYVSPTEGATIDAVLLAAKLAEEYEGKSICVPGNTKLGSISDSLQQYSKEHPEKYGKFSAKDLFLSMSSNYPCSSTLKSAAAPDSPKIIVEQNGKFTNVYAEGNLAPYQAVGCIPLAEVKNTFTPPDLYKGAAECIARDNYDFALGLFALAGMYGDFDSARVTDETAWQAKTVLKANLFSSVPNDKKVKLNDVLTSMTKNPILLKNLCSEVSKVGMPNYYPSYMILHGAKAFTGNPHDGALLNDFDSQKVWSIIKTTYLNCPS